MARKRFISPKFYTHAELYDAEASTGLPLRLGYQGLWGQCDRRGLFAWRPRELKLQILPYDVVDFGAVLEALESAGFVRSYVVHGKRYGYIPSLIDHQNFHPGEKADPTIPLPPAGAFDTKPTRPKPSHAQKDAENVAEDAKAVAEDAKNIAEEHLGHPKQLASNAASTTTSNTASTARTTASYLPVATTDPTFDPSSVDPLVRRMTDELLAAANPHEALAFQTLMANHRTPAFLVMELHGVATGLHVVRGTTTGKTADIADVMRAIAEMAATGSDFTVPLFRGFLRRVADRPPEPARIEERQLAKLQADITKRAAQDLTRGERNADGVIVPIAIVADDSPEARQERAKARSEAMARFRAEAGRKAAPAPQETAA